MPLVRQVNQSSAATGLTPGSPAGTREGSPATVPRARLGFYLLLTWFALILMLTGCARLGRNPVPTDLGAVASIPDMPVIRAWAGRPSAAMEADLERSFAQQRLEDFPLAADGRVRYPHLALSGGGSQGAFGAGFLKGWSRTGQRPIFKMVTGVSTGALMAPFAFLGPEYDETLGEFYTTTASRDIFLRRWLPGRLLWGEALTDTAPLEALIAQFVDDALLRKIAEAHNQGRRLYIGTVDLDAQRFVVWNMGLIATSGRPEALPLFRKVMLASASIPVVFPPVFFEVEANGKRYDEMHVDGAVGANVFYNGGVFRTSIIREHAGREDVFVIHNGRLTPVPNPTPRSLRGIALRSLDAAGRAAVVGDLFRIYAATRQEQASFQWVTIPEDVDLARNEVFDPELMQRLHAVGYQKALAGPEWTTLPPGLWDDLAPPRLDTIRHE
jgi:predicted acylesterase/phospholipase RssA